MMEQAHPQEQQAPETGEAVAIPAAPAQGLALKPADRKGPASKSRIREKKQ